MSAQQHFLPSATSTLVATVAKELLTADGVDTTYFDRAEFLVVNTGANPLTIAIYYSPAGTGWGLDTVNAPTVAAGAQVRIPLTLTCMKLRMVATSTAGTSCTVEGVWVRAAR